MVVVSDAVETRLRINGLTPPSSTRLIINEDRNAETIAKDLVSRHSPTRGSTRFAGQTLGGRKVLGLVRRQGSGR